MANNGWCWFLTNKVNHQLVRVANDQERSIHWVFYDQRRNHRQQTTTTEPPTTNRQQQWRDEEHTWRWWIWWMILTMWISIWRNKHQQCNNIWIEKIQNIRPKRHYRLWSCTPFQNNAWIVTASPQYPVMTFQKPYVGQGTFGYGAVLDNKIRIKLRVTAP